MTDPKTKTSREHNDSSEPEVVDAQVIEDEPTVDQEAVNDPKEGAAEAPSREEDQQEYEAADEEAAETDPQAEVAEWRDKYLRLHAEWDTYRRRMREQREEEKVLATEKLVEALIPVLDDFDRTIAYAQENGETGLLSGVEAVNNKLDDTLERQGVQIIDPEGQAYNALEAQAVGTVDDPSVPDETVAQVYQKGYKMGNKVLRPAMVTITTGGPKREPETDEDEPAAN